jgi:UDPglucose 6-dehydrogenase
MAPRGAKVKIAVVGLWHLGLVTAASLATAGHTVVALADDEATADALQQGVLPLFEPGLDDAIRDAIASGGLRFTSDRAELRDAEVVWITYDTVIDEEDRAAVQQVIDDVRRFFPYLTSTKQVMISSQLPVGSTRALAEEFRATQGGGAASFAYSPENLRLGQALASFQRPDRVVVGVDEELAKRRIADLFAPFTDQIEWMRLESAEMTKHALNAWLATSIAYANEIATLCERVGADATDVARGLKSDPRVGQRAYVRPGAAFAGGTLGRDLLFLAELARNHGVPLEVVPAVRRSNDAHRSWPQRRLQEVFPELGGRSIAILGLTYKPGTSTLRRSSAIELARWLHEQRAGVAGWDPAIAKLPTEIAAIIDLRSSFAEAIRGADAAVISTEWPELTALRAEDVLSHMVSPIVLDPGRFLEGQLRADPRIRYLAVGTAS